MCVFLLRHLGCAPRILFLKIQFIMEKIISKFIWKNKRSRVSKGLMKRNARERGLVLPDLKLYHNAVIIKTLSTG